MRALLILTTLLVAPLFSQAYISPSEDKRLYDGAAVIGDQLYFTHFNKAESLILKAPTAATETGHSPQVSHRLPEGTRAAGMVSGPNGKLWIADFKNHQIIKFDPASGESEVFFQTPEMSQPNDLAINSEGVLFASDPNWSAKSGRIWRITPDKKAKVLQAELGVVNGIALSPDGQKLYVTETAPRGKLIEFQIDGETLSAPKVLASYPSFQTDGIAVDTQGNILVPLMESSPKHGKKLIVYNAQGKELKTIELPGQYPSNITVDSEGVAYITYFGKPGKEKGAFVQRLDWNKP